MMSLLGGWKWPAIALVALTVLGYIGWLKVANANLKVDVAKQSAAIESLTMDLRWAETVTSDNAAALERIQARHAKELRAITADRNRIAAEAKKMKILKENIHVAALACVGVPPAGRALADWVRDNPEAGGD